MSYSYLRSCDVDIPLRINIGRFAGERLLPPVQSLIDAPESRLAGAFRSSPPSDLYITCQVFCDGTALSHPTQTRHTSFHKSTVWDEWLELPIQHEDLVRDSCIAITVWDVKNPREKMIVGSAVLNVFNADGRVREGDFTLELTEGISAQGLVINASRILGSGCDSSNSTGKANTGSAADAVSTSEGKAELARLQRLMQKMNNSEMQLVPWLDAYSVRRASAVQDECRQKLKCLTVTVRLPYFQLPIVFSEIAGKSGGYTVLDPEILYTENLVEEKHVKLTRTQQRGKGKAEDLKPNPTIRDALATLTAKPPTYVMTPDEKDQIWLYRHFLSKDKKALPKFLRSVNWKNKTEVRMAIEVMNKWAVMDVDDALELLDKTFTNAAVRMHAVKCLDAADDDTLILYLLQLVQALKYEPLVSADGEDISLLPPPSTKPETGDGGDGDESGDTPRSLPPAKINFAPLSLAGFLTRRALKNRQLGSFLFWYLLVECRDKNKAIARLYTRVWMNFTAELETGSPEQRALMVMLRRQRNFFTGIRNLSNDIRSSKMNRLKKIEFLKSKLRDTDDLRSFEPLTMPLDPNLVCTCPGEQVIVSGINADSAHVFKSALNPLKITFFTQSRMEYNILYKNGDDLRQDQLCMQILFLMDRLLKNENLDLKFSPYHTLATSPDIGMVEMVLPSEPVASILSKHGNIQKYLQKHNGDPTAPYEISKECMDLYIKSCAGYCVFTYLLGVGDRHFDNLMIAEDGRLFHIDFGYILGRDPKPYPPPMKLTKEMVEAMGGANSEEMRKFRSHCYSAFLILRKHANLFVNLFALMVDSSVHDIALDPDKTVMKVQEKFRLDLSDEMAVKAMQELIDESVSAMFAQFVERIHSWAQYWRK
eukprot:m.160416 g.160416  ORF g.160416 m.160416 type:complete len:879 (-) comp18023_c0_seq5:78-2714(-)